MERLASGALVALHDLGRWVEGAKRSLEKERVNPLYRAYFELVKEQGKVMTYGLR